MSQLVYFPLDEATTIAVEIDPDGFGFEEAGPKGQRLLSSESLASALSRGSRAVEVALREFHAMPAQPDEIEIELGLKLSVEAGVVLAKSTSDCHFLVKLAWRPKAE